ncbi:PHB depolymerase family esterase [Actinoplanes sp. TFC3]|uniref:alpha/beta hydrolase family esterase n=1 Tax=Actinoplanes sp. TFC3 TaxID=1710355 RepID=UPI00082F71C0|nr:PHB depolymerase family esterase [Actinoplanes sp. TFC3]
MPSTPTATRSSVTVGEATRTFTLVGTAAPGEARPLILVFHGSRQTGDKHRAFTGGVFDALAARGALVAYLDGYRGNWNDARREDRFPARRADIDDVGFARAVISMFASGRRIDPSRVYAVGYSNGGQMVLRLAHEIPDLLAGVTVIAATMPAPENFLASQAPRASLPVLLIHGTNDPIVSYQGGTMNWALRTMFKVGGSCWSATRTARYFAERNGITTEPRSTRLPKKTPADPTEVERTTYEESNVPPVVLYTIHGGGHTIPGASSAPALIGKTSHQVNAAGIIAQFFDL